jgi:hypothetical protein
VLPDLYKSLLNSLAASEQTGVSREYDIFNKVVHVVTDAITIDPEATLAFAHEQSLMSDKKVSLDVYIVKGFGLAHHQVLLAGYLLERLVDEGILLGTVTLDSALSALTGEVLLYQSRSGATLRFAPNERRIAEIVH